MGIFDNFAQGNQGGAGGNPYQVGGSPNYAAGLMNWQQMMGQHGQQQPRPTGMMGAAPGATPTGMMPTAGGGTPPSGMMPPAGGGSVQPTGMMNTAPDGVSPTGMMPTASGGGVSPPQQQPPPGLGGYLQRMFGQGGGSNQPTGMMNTAGGGGNVQPTGMMGLAPQQPQGSNWAGGWNVNG